jgi:hypothetical protein
VEGYRSGLRSPRKRWKGSVLLKARGSLKNPESRLWVRGNDRTSKVVRILAQADAVRRALADTCRAPLPPVTQIVCFIDSGVAQLDAPNEFRGIQIVTRLVALRRLVTTAPPIAGPEEVDSWHRLLAEAFPSMLGDRVARDPRPDP